MVELFALFILANGIEKKVKKNAKVMADIYHGLEITSARVYNISNLQTKWIK